MNDYQEYRSYGSYLSRVLAIILAFLVLVLAVWFVVRLANDGDDVAQNEAETSQNEESNIATTGSQDNTAVGAENGVENEADAANNSQDEPAASNEDQQDATAQEDSEGRVLATNTEIDPQLPNTGSESLMALVVVPGLAYSSVQYARSRKSIKNLYLHDR